MSIICPKTPESGLKNAGTKVLCDQATIHHCEWDNYQTDFSLKENPKKNTRKASNEKKKNYME